VSSAATRASACRCSGVRSPSTPRTRTPAPGWRGAGRRGSIRQPRGPRRRPGVGRPHAGHGPERLGARIARSLGRTRRRGRPPRAAIARRGRSAACHPG
jgi:hypothetical protein